MSDTGLLTNHERDVVAGEHQVADREGRVTIVRHHVKKRMDLIERDLELLAEAGEGDLVAEFEERFREDLRRSDDGEAEKPFQAP